MNSKTNISQDFPHAAAFQPSDTFRAGRDMPEGSIRWHLDCADNPLDLRPAADLIIKAIDERLAEIPPNQKLAVVMGEYHMKPTHIALQRLVVQRLHRRQQSGGPTFTVHFEEPHNDWSQDTQNLMNINVPKGLFYRPGRYDLDGRATLSSELVFGFTDDATYSRKNLQAACYRLTGLRTQFCDASKSYQYYRHLDFKDPLNWSAMISLFWHSPWRYFIKSRTARPTGVAIRNAVMLKNSMDFVSQERLMLFCAGMYHIAGSDLGDKFKHSLCGLFNKKGVAVLPVILTSKENSLGLNKLPQAAFPTLRDYGVVIDGLGDKDMNVRISDYGEEEQYLKAINAASGGELTYIDIKERQKYVNVEIARQHAQELIARYTADRKPPGHEPVAALG